MRKSKRSRACQLTRETVEAVHRRDRGCIFCKAGRWPGATEYEKRWLETAHIVSRAHGGLGIETNAVAACKYHHMQLDNGNKGWAAEMNAYIDEYMWQQYPEWSRDEQVYRKGE